MSTKAILQLVRPKMSLIGFTFALIGVYLSGHPEAITSTRNWLGLFVVPITIAYSFIINDFYDLPVDRIAKPDRPLPSKTISVKGAILLAIVLAGFALSVGWFMNVPTGVFVTWNLVLASLYSIILKRVPFIGNASIALLNASIVVYGAFIIGDVTKSAWIVAAIMLLYVFIYEVLYAAEDEEEDRLAGGQTTATFFGNPTTLNIVRILSILFMFTLFLPFFFGLGSIYYFVTMVGVCIIPTIWVLMRLRNETHIIKRARRVMTYVYYLAIVPILFLHPAFPIFLRG